MFDSADHRALGRWWSAALGWPVTVEAGDETEVSSGVAGVPSLVFVPVPEVKTVKNRVHLDLRSVSDDDHRRLVERLRAAGALPVDVGQRDVPWTVLADPEGNELCVLEPRPGLADAPLASIVVDTVVPGRLAPFWAAASGWREAGRTATSVSLVGPAGWPTLDLVAVPEPHTTKNRVHLDVAPRVGDDRDAEVERLVSLGARPVDVGQAPEATWVVLVDLEENEFCVLRPR